MRRPEDPEFYAAVLALRRHGFRVERANPGGSRINGKDLTNEALVLRAWALLHPPEQLELFDFARQ